MTSKMGKTIAGIVVGTVIAVVSSTYAIGVGILLLIIAVLGLLFGWI
jgi:hypothetical protein